MTGIRSFEADTPITPGITLLEASAGTGKTYQITNLVLRLIAEQGVPLPEILVVTFTHAATAELRERVRVRLGEALAAVEAGVAPDQDAVLVSLVGHDNRPLVRRRLVAARESFDQALISTIHGFCQRMLALHAFETGAAFGRELVADEQEAVGRAVDDWIVARTHGASTERVRFLRQGAGLQRAPLLGLARLALSDPDMPTVPARAPRSIDDWLSEVAALAVELAAEDGPVHTLHRMASKKTRDFDGRSYGARYADDRRDALLQWLDTPTTVPSSADKWVEWHSADRLMAKAKTAAGRALAADPLWERLHAVIAAGDGAVVAERLAFVRHVRSALALHHATRGTQSFHDLLRDLDHALRDPERGAPLAQAIRGRFQVALIDEFQDTDALQWRIFGRVFGGVGEPDPALAARHCLYLIGDPKQAIYGFRGANVHVYLAARATTPPDRRFTMARNYRSDGVLIDAANHVLGRSGMFGDSGIEYVRVSAHHESRRLVWPEPAHPEAAPLQLRWVDDRVVGEAGDDLLGNGVLKAVLPDCVAAEVVDLLESSARIADRAVRPGDVAVLVRGHAQAALVQAALTERGVPAVVASQGSVFDSAEALSLLRWLRALAAPGDDAVARVLAVDPLFDWTVAELPAADETDLERSGWWEQWLTQLARWRLTFAHDGFMAAFHALLDHVPPWAADRASLATRVLGLAQGERRLTDLRHLAELLHAHNQQGTPGLVGLATWFDTQRQARSVADADAAALRLERDDEAVQVVTVHRSKGLQYGVVFIPFLWADEARRVSTPLSVSDADHPAERALVLWGSGDVAEAAVERARQEQHAEGMRLLYVALTRARHRVVVYWPGAKSSRDSRIHSPVAAMLHGAAPQDAVPDRISGAVERHSSGELEAPADQFAELTELAATSAGTVAVSPLLPPHTQRWRQAASQASPALNARSFPRPAVSDGWRRHSYSALTRADIAAQAEELVDPARGLGFDDDRVASEHSRVPHVEAPPRLAHIQDLEDVPLAAFPAGADAGTCLHSVLEHVDFTWGREGASDAEQEARNAVVERELHRHGFGDPKTVALLSEHLPQVLQTPLGPLLSDTRLCDVPLSDRLDELRFDFPIAGGDRHGRPGGPVARVTAGALAEALSLRGDSDAVPAAWVARVADLGFAPLAGIMTGSIDLVFRVREPEGPPSGRWFVVDYKSNRLDPHQTGRTPIEHFHFAGMRHEMAHHHYFLQAHLYLLAVHRFLRHRLGEAYDYDRHIGGVAYLFVRGMTGPDATDPTRTGGRPGVFTDRPPLAVIDALDSIFDDPGAVASLPSEAP